MEGQKLQNNTNRWYQKLLSFLWEMPNRRQESKDKNQNKKKMKKVGLMEF
jgi:hypothetical protein